jgi:hypothetical protein
MAFCLMSLTREVSNYWRQDLEAIAALSRQVELGSISTNQQEDHAY